MTETKADLQKRVQHAEWCLFKSLIYAMREREKHTAKYGEDHWSVWGDTQLISGYVGGLFFLTGESEESIRARAEKAAGS